MGTPGLEVSAADRDRFIQGGRLNRTIPKALEALDGLLREGTDATNQQVADTVRELEVYHEAVSDSFGVALQHEADAANTMGSIRRALSNPRLKTIGVTSALALEERAAE